MVRCSEIYDNLTLAVGGHTISVFEEKVVSKRFLLENPYFEWVEKLLAFLILGGLLLSWLEIG